MVRALISVLLAALLCTGVAASAQDARLSFAKGGYWLTNPAQDDFTIRREGVASRKPDDKVRLTLYRLSDQALRAQIITARAMRSLSEGELLRRVAETKPLWQGDLVMGDLAMGDRDQMSVPLEAAAGALPSGVYILTAAAITTPNQRVAQWFAKSNLAVRTTFIDGRAFVAAFDRTSRQGFAKAQLQWCDSNGRTIGEILPMAETGSALLSPPEQAAVLIASDQDGRGDFDTAVVPPQEQRAHLDGAAVYPSAAVYQSDKPFSFLVAALGEVPEFRLNTAVIEPKRILSGLWQIDVPRDTKGDLKLTVNRASQTLQTTAVPAAPDQRYTVQWLKRPAAASSQASAVFKLRLLQNGKPASNADGTLALRLPAAKSEARLTQSFKTDAAGIATINLDLDPAQMQPGAYQIQLTVAGVPVNLATPLLVNVYPAERWLAIAPQFSDSAVPENVTAQFKVQIRQASGTARSVPVAYSLARETYKFEWYQDADGQWTYRTKTNLDVVQTGQATPASTKTDSAVIAVPVDAGRYRLTVQELNGPLEATQSFTAGWWLTQPTPATPEKIELNAQAEGPSFDQSKIAVFVDPPFAANVWVAALNTSSSATPPMSLIPDEGGFAYIPRTDLQPGQPLMLLAYGVSSDPGKPLVQAEGKVIIPLGRKLTMQLNPAVDKKSAATVTVAGLPVDQPLDKNIAQGFVAFYDELTQQLLDMTAITIDTEGAATITLPAIDLTKTKLKLRVFVAYADRLDISELSIELPPANTSDTAAVKPATGRSK